MTKCCGRPICPRCLETNPRLARYNPCLACLAGAGVIQATSSVRSRSGGKHTGDSGDQSARVENLDGAVKDQDLFALGDDNEDDEDDDVSTNGEEEAHVYRSASPPPSDAIQTVSPLPKTPPPPPPVIDNAGEESPATDAGEDQQPTKPDPPAIYRLRRGDTLMGIALRFRLDVCFFHGSRPFPQFILTDRTIRRWSYAG